MVVLVTDEMILFIKKDSPQEIKYVFVAFKYFLFPELFQQHLKLLSLLFHAFIAGLYDLTMILPTPCDIEPVKKLYHFSMTHEKLSALVPCLIKVRNCNTIPRKIQQQYLFDSK